MSDPFRIASATPSSPFGLTQQGDLRKGFNDLIDAHTHYWVYVRRNTAFPHVECYLHDTKSFDMGCTECFGTGYKVQFEKHKCRRVVPAGTVQSPITEMGYLTKYSILIYTPRYYYPKSKDLYLEVEWDKELPFIEEYGTPVKVVNAFQVDEIVAHMEDEVTYTSAACDTYGVTQKQIDAWAKTLGEVYVNKVVV